MIEAPEGALALAINRREAGAFERLVRRYEKPLYNYVERLVRNAGDAQEVVQDVFLRAHKALTRQYGAERCRGLALRSWLFRIARNLAFNRLRARRPGEREGDLELADGVLPEGDGGSIRILCDLEHREELLRLDRAIASLPAESRELVLLRFIEEMSYAEIARTVGGSEAALRGKVFRALKALRAALERQENDHAL